MSSNLCVFTTVESEASAALLRRSCERVGIDLQLYGTGNWRGYADGKIRGALEFLRTRTESVCMFVDGHDSFILEPAEEIVGEFNEFPEPVVISCEKTCWPDATLWDEFPDLNTKSLFLYPNAGGWIGYRSCLIQTLEQLLKHIEQWPGDDQRCWHEHCKADRDKYSIVAVGRDTECRIFQCMGGTGEMSDKGRNTATNTDPRVWHFNGRTPGRDEWYQKLTGDKLL